MRRYWIDKKYFNGQEVRFEAELFHHIFDVCRQTKGSHFEVLLEGQAHFIEVIQLEKKFAIGKVLETRQIPELPKPHIHVALSISRYQVMDAVVEKLVEMGVASLHPVFSDFSFVKSTSSFPRQKLDRWHKIVVSATQQSGRGELMKIEEPKNLSLLAQEINRTSAQLGLFAYEGQADTPIQQYLRSKKSPDITDIWCVIGSEGGFSPQEVENMRGLGLNPVTLGSQVLRVETACMTLVSVLKYEFDLMT